MSGVGYMVIVKNNPNDKLSKEAEYLKITIITPADSICPICGKEVNRLDKNIEFVISGHGKFKRKQYYHKACIKRRGNV